MADGGHHLEATISLNVKEVLELAALMGEDYLDPVALMDALLQPVNVIMLRSPGYVQTRVNQIWMTHCVFM